LILINVD